MKISAKLFQQISEQPARLGKIQPIYSNNAFIIKSIFMIISSLGFCCIALVCDSK